MTQHTFHPTRTPADNTLFYQTLPALTVRGKHCLIRVSVYTTGKFGFGMSEEWRQFAKVALLLEPQDVTDLSLAICGREEWHIIRPSTRLIEEPPMRKLRYTASKKGGAGPRLTMHCKPYANFVDMSARMDPVTVAKLDMILQHAQDAAT